MRLLPVVPAPAPLAEAVAQHVGAPLRWHSRLDVDVYRLTGASGPDLVVRAFDQSVGPGPVTTAAHVLVALEATRFPAERCLGVVALEPSRQLLVTEYVEPAASARPAALLAWCAALLGRLAARPAADLAPGGGWHRLGPTPTTELDAALRLLDGTAGAGELLDAVAEADDATGLPEGLVHADLTPPNAVPRDDQPPLIVDWVGTGRGARVWPFAFLLYAAGPRLAHVVVERYARSVELSAAEWDRLPGIMIARPLTLDAWAVGYERLTVRTASARLRRHRDRVRATVAAAQAARR